MAEPARKFQDIGPDIRPKLYDVNNVDDNAARRRASFKDLNANESKPEKPNTGSVAEQEANGSNVIKGPWKDSTSEAGAGLSKIGGLAAFKKKIPIIAILITLVGGAIGIGGLMGTALLPIHIKEIFFEHLNDASPALSIRTNASLFNKFNGVKNSFVNSSTGKCNIKCKFGSLSDTQIRLLESKGYEVKIDEGASGKPWMLGRKVMSELTLLDGTIIKNGADFATAMKDPVNAADFKKTFNSKTAYFLNTKFGSMLYTKFGLDKASKLSADIKDRVDGKFQNAKDAVIDSMRSALGLAPKTDLPKMTPREFAMTQPKYAKALTAIDGLQAKVADKTNDVIGAMCSAYNVGKGFLYATKAAKIAAFATFAMVFLAAADQIKAGEADPEVISAVGDQLTKLDEDGKSATDSNGYQMAAYGKAGVLSEKDRTYGASLTNGLLGFIGTTLATVSFGGTAVIKTLGAICGVSGNIVTDIATTCPEQITVALAAMTATGPETLGIGAAISALVGAGWCVSKMAGIMVLANIAVGTIVTGGTKMFVDSELPTVDDTTIGNDLGNSFYTGTAQIMGGASATYGLKAGNQQEIKQYAIDTATIKKQEDEIARYDARNDPFDIYNQYSFVGSMARSLNVDVVYNSSSLLSYFGNILSIVPRSLATLTNNVGAESETESNLYAEGQCEDPSLEAIGVNADSLCNPAYVMSSDEMNSDINQVIDFMITGNSDGPYIDDMTGESLEYPGETVEDASFNTYQKKSEYKNYLDNCANRIEPLGETQSPLESPYYEWEVGEKCGEQSEMLSNFRTYTMDKAINDTMDEDLSAVGSTSSVSGGSVDPGDSSQPDDTVKKGDGWTLKDGVDYSDISCASGSTDKDTYTHPTKHFVIRLCDTKLGEVSSLISQRVVNMVNAAKKDGVNLAGSSWRSYEEQQRLRADNCNRGHCSPPTASPGNSQHERGIGTDFGAASKGGEVWNWLVANGAKYGYHNLPSEYWHWSMSGG